jgi:hypothetical protein
MFPELMNQRGVPGQGIEAPLGPGMFDGLTSAVAPAAEDMERERQRILADKHVELESHHVKIFDLHEAKDVVEYTKLMKDLVKATQALTHKIWANERQLVDTGKGQRWMIYMEWSVFKLNVKHTPAVGSPRPKKKEKA